MTSRKRKRGNYYRILPLSEDHRISIEGKPEPANIQVEEIAVVMDTVNTSDQVQKLELEKQVASLVIHSQEDFEYLPVDLQGEIAKKLDLKSLRRLGRTSKALSNLCFSVLKSAISSALSIISEAQRSRTFQKDDVQDAFQQLANITEDSPRFRDFALENGVLAPLLTNLCDNSNLPIAMLRASTRVLRNATRTLCEDCRSIKHRRYEHVSALFTALPALSNMIRTTDEEVLADACKSLASLSSDFYNRIQEIIDSGVCRKVVDLLMHNSYEVHCAALRTIANIATGDDRQTQTIINMSVLPCLLALLGSPKMPIRKYACWAVSNICAGPRHQLQAVMDAHIMHRLVDIVANDEPEVKFHAVWALSCALSNGTGEQIVRLRDLGIIKPLCDQLPSSESGNVVNALSGLRRFIGIAEIDAKANIDTEDQTRVIVEQIVPCLIALLNSPETSVRRDTCLTVGDVCAGNATLRQAAIDAMIIPRLIQLLSTEEDSRTNVNALRAICNVLSGKTPEHVRYIAEQGCIKLLCDFLTSEDSEIARQSVEGLELFLSVGDAKAISTTNPYVALIKSAGGFDKLEGLRSHQAYIIRTKAVTILDSYCK
eukprot:TRINITY_DN7743_c0_g1_i1.p1 TRINITY_DN7743_c0_g1~~TRINITY_DN7743_c0_g1_i1.p1  ORF type:complete len:600 (+),score=81.23 TRINITY_DN7743_c0_g1_i1:92-1891(+)